MRAFGWAAALALGACIGAGREAERPRDPRAGDEDQAGDDDSSGDQDSSGDEGSGGFLPGRDAGGPDGGGSDPHDPDASCGASGAGGCFGPGEGCPTGQGCCEGLQCWFLQCVNALICTRPCEGPRDCGEFCEGTCCKRPGTQTGQTVCYPERFGVCGPDCGCAEGCAVGAP